MRGSREKPGRIIGKYRGRRVGYDVRELVRLDAVPNVEQEPAAGPEDTPRLGIAGCGGGYD